MTVTLTHPGDELSESRKRRFLPVAEHFAGNDKMIRKALEKQAELGRVFDITMDCEDGSKTGGEADHAAMVRDLLKSDENKFNRCGVRIHDPSSPHWRKDLEIILSDREAAARVAYVTIPKGGTPEELTPMIIQARTYASLASRTDGIPIHVLIESQAGLRNVWDIAALPNVELLDFGLMDFISDHDGIIPESAMRSPGQFDHALVRRAKSEMVAAAAYYGLVPAHNVTLALKDAEQTQADATRARNEFGFLRMWSIYPTQIDAIVAAMKPDFSGAQRAFEILCLAQEANWGPVQHDGLHDRATYRTFWNLLQQAKACGETLPDGAEERFFAVA